MKNENSENEDMREMVYIEKITWDLVQWFAQNLPLNFLVKNALYHSQMVIFFYFFGFLEIFRAIKFIFSY